MHRAVAALILALTNAGSLPGQVSSWQLVGGVGGITGQSLAHRAVFVGALGRDVSALSNLRLGAELTFGHLPTGNLVCAEAEAPGSCELRELDHFGALSITGAISVRAGIVTPYVRGNFGGWTGRDTGAPGGESSRENGLAIAGEWGIRVHDIAAALRVDQLDSAPRGTLRIASIVVRVSF